MTYRVVLEDIRIALAVDFQLIPGEAQTRDDPGSPPQIRMDRIEISNEEKPVMMAQNILRYLPEEVLETIRDRIYDKIEEGSL